MIPGVHLVHKEPGESSFDVVRRFKREAFEEGLKKFPLGHGGTLDPFAEGLLLVLAGQGTRLMELMHPLPKTYLARVSWGQETDTGDLQGRIVAEGPVPAPAELEGVLEPFLGWTDQVPPATSAKKIDGEPAYRRAHRGEEVEMRPCRVYLHQAAWVRHDLPRTSLLRLTCRGGYYVRSLVRDLGRSMGRPAHLAGLLREAIGPWRDPGPGERGLAFGPSLLPWCRRRVLDAVEADHLAHGRPISIGEVMEPAWRMPEGFPDPGAPVAAFHAGKTVALLEARDGAFWTTANLRGGL